MDPSFLFAIANTLRERQIAEAAGKQAAFELQKQQEEETLLKKRKEFLESMKQDSNKLVARSNEYPADVLLQSSLMIQYMLINGFVPDSFKEEKDKEQCILLHKKLVNLNNKCLPVLSKEDIAQIEACLAANHKIAYLEYIYPRVAARERMDEINKKYHAAIKRSIFAWVIFCFWSVFAAYVGVILAITTIKIDDEILEMLAVGGIVLGMIALILPVLYRVYPREISKLKQTREQYLLQAEINSAKLWQGIREVYPVLPSVEQLRQEYEQLRQTVDLTLRKYSPPGEEHAEA